MRNQITFACALALMAAPAAAQDGSEASGARTVEGAQKFLAEYTTTHATEAIITTFATSSGGWRVHYNDVEKDGAIKFAIAGFGPVSTTDRCVSTVGFYNLRNRGKLVGQFYGEAFAPGERISQKLDWSKASNVQTGAFRLIEPSSNSQVATGEHYVSFIVQGWMGDLVLLYPSQEDAQRVAFAIRFLVDQCGFKTETGF